MLLKISSPIGIELIIELETFWFSELNLSVEKHFFTRAVTSFYWLVSGCMKAKLSAQLF